jgi:hypothetical protein
LLFVAVLNIVALVLLLRALPSPNVLDKVKAPVLARGRRLRLGGGRRADATSVEPISEIDQPVTDPPFRDLRYWWGLAASPHAIPRPWADAGQPDRRGLIKHTDTVETVARFGLTALSCR